MLDPVLSPSTELARFHMDLVFTMPRHFVRSHASSFPSPFFFISFSTCFSSFVSVSLFLYYRAHFIFIFFPQTGPFHSILLTLTILSKDSSTPNMSINSSLFPSIFSNSYTPHITPLSVRLKIVISFSLKHHV